MTPTDLARIATAIYGDLWQSQLAGAVQVSDRTVRRWAAGDRQIPIGLATDLLRAATERASELDEAIAELIAMGGQ